MTLCDYVVGEIFCVEIISVFYLCDVHAKPVITVIILKKELNSPYSFSLSCSLRFFFNHPYFFYKHIYHFLHLGTAAIAA